MTSRDVCDLAGCTYRMLDYWCRTGRVPDVDPYESPGSGGRREFTRKQAEHVRLLAALLRSGLSMNLAHRIAVATAKGQKVHALSDSIIVEIPQSLMPSFAVAS